jgi:hypothetical protein
MTFRVHFSIIIKLAFKCTINGTLTRCNGTNTSSRDRKSCREAIARRKPLTVAQIVPSSKHRAHESSDIDSGALYIKSYKLCFHYRSGFSNSSLVWPTISGCMSSLLCFLQQDFCSLKTWFVICATTSYVPDILDSSIIWLTYFRSCANGIGTSWFGFEAVLYGLEDLSLMQLTTVWIQCQTVRLQIHRTNAACGLLQQTVTIHRWLTMKDFDLHFSW